MGKKLKIAVSALLAVLMALSLAGALAEGTREPQPIPEGDWNVPYPELVNITTVKGYGADQVFEGNDVHTSNPWTRAWLE